MRIGLVHGHLVMPRGDEIALDAVRRWLHVDVLVSGATGRASTRQVGPGLLVDPGSVTGMYCSHASSGLASFSLLSIDAGKVSSCLMHYTPTLASTWPNLETSSFKAQPCSYMQVTTFTYTQQSDGTVSFQRHDFKRKAGSTMPPSVPQPASKLAPIAVPTAAPVAAEGCSVQSTSNDATNTAQNTTVSARSVPQKTDTPKGRGEEGDEEGDGAQIMTEELKEVGQQSSGAPAVFRDASGESS